MVSRRDFLRSAGALGMAALAVPCALFPQKAIAQAVAAALNAKQVPQFVQTLHNPLDPGFIFRPKRISSFLTRTDISEQQPINLVIRTLFNPNAESSWFKSVVAIIIQ